MEKRFRFEVPESAAGQRADRVIVELFVSVGEAIPRAEVQRWMAEGRVAVDGVPLRKKKTSLPPGAEIVVDVAPPPLSRAEPDPSIEVTVVYEDEHLLVVDKPAGLVVHPARGHPGGTLVNGLLARGGFEATNADPRDPEGHLRPGIVHRLDKDTSGLLVVARTPRCREGLKSLFQTHDIERSYLAIVQGTARKARFDTPHGRHPTQRLKFTSKLDGRGKIKRAITEVEPLRQLGPAALVRCRLETGRTHQIRVHLAEQAQTPILGDALYGRPSSDAGLRAIGEGLGRQALHAAELGFVHPATGDPMHWESPLPEALARALEAIERLTKPST